MNYTIHEYPLAEVAPERLAIERKRMGLLYYTQLPTLTLYTPESESRTALMLVPGGGYAFTAIDLEGHHFATWLASEGYTVGVLKYRTPEEGRELPLQDWLNGFACFTNHCLEQGIIQSQVGVAGFSAGSHLTLSAISQQAAASRPGFTIQFYPLVSLEEPLAHKGSATKLLGKEPNSELRRDHSPIHQLDANFPPTHILYSEDDLTVTPENSHQLYGRLLELSVSVTLTSFSSGGHGWGFNPEFAHHIEMKQALLNFLKTHANEEK